MIVSLFYVYSIVIWRARQASCRVGLAPVLKEASQAVLIWWEFTLNEDEPPYSKQPGMHFPINEEGIKNARFMRLADFINYILIFMKYDEAGSYVSRGPASGRQYPPHS